MRERVLDIEVIFVVENGDSLGCRCGSSISGGGGIVSTLRRDGNGREVDLLGHVG